MISGRTRLVGLIGNPVEGSLSPRMQNAAFAALGLDWAYVPLPVERNRLEEAIRALVALGFVGANVTAPYKLDVARICDAHEPSVNTLVVSGGDIRACSTDAAIIEGKSAERPVVIGAGGAAAAFVAALSHARQFSRRSDWPPDVSGADLVVNATSERHDVVAELGTGQTLIDLPYPETATATAARAAGAEVVAGLEVLVAQGAASFELWTGLAAPFAVMRAAAGL